MKTAHCIACSAEYLIDDKQQPECPFCGCKLADTFWDDSDDDFGGEE